MNYTKSNSYTEHAGTGQRMHDAAKAVPTQVSDSDLNMVIWSLMEVIKDAGLPGIDFSAENPDSYKQLLKALQKQRDHTHPNATQAQPGFMSAADKQGLDNLSTHVQTLAPLSRPVFAKRDADLSGGQISLQAADNQQYKDATINYHGSWIYLYATRKSDGQMVGGYIDLAQIGSGVVCLSDAAPAGLVSYFAASFAPAGWIACNGAAISRTVYARLFAVLGTHYGAGDGSTTFNLPDLRGEFIRGWDSGRGLDAGRIFGSVQGDEIRSHHHGTPYTWGVVSNTSNGRSVMMEGNNSMAWTSNSGGNETRPHNMALLPCIKY